MNKTTEALKMAIERLKVYHDQMCGSDDPKVHAKLIETLEKLASTKFPTQVYTSEEILNSVGYYKKEALESQEQEPVGYVSGLPIVTPQAIRKDKNDVFNIPVYAG